MIFHTHVDTKVGPAGGYLAYEDGTTYSWDQPRSFLEKKRTLLHGQSLRIRRDPSMSDYTRGKSDIACVGLQVKATSQDVGEFVFHYVSDNYGFHEDEVVALFGFCVYLSCRAMKTMKETKARLYSVVFVLLFSICFFRMLPSL